MQHPLEPPAERQWLIETIQQGYLTLDRQGRITGANAAAGVILGDAPEALVGRSLGTAMPELDGPTIEEMLAGRLAESTVGEPGPTPFERPPAYRLFARSTGTGAELIVLDLREKLRQDDELKRLTATMAVSQELLRHKNEELDRSLDRMARMNDQLAALDDLKSQFLSNTSHELRTPLNTILGSLQLVREGLCENRQEEQDYLDSALDAARRLLKVINEMLDSAKLSAGKMHFLIEVHRVNDLFDEIYSQLNPQARQQGLRLSFEFPHGQDLFFRADFEKTKQALLNVVGNALKFTEQGVIAVSAQVAADQPDLVRFTVRDTGIGIPPDRQQELFESFTQIDGSPTRRYEGNGLGLAIAKNLIEMMGGTISLKSEGVGHGTEVEFTLPLGSSNQTASKALEGSLEELLLDLPRSF